MSATSFLILAGILLAGVSLFMAAVSSVGAAHGPALARVARTRPGVAAWLPCPQRDNVLASVRLTVALQGAGAALTVLECEHVTDAAPTCGQRCLDPHGTEIRGVASRMGY